MEHKGAFKRHHSDYGSIRNYAQEIVKGARKEWNMKTSPPTLNIKRYGPWNTALVAKTQFEPYKLLQYSTYLCIDDNDEAICSAVRALCQKRGTRNAKLRKELNRKMKQTFDKETLQKILAWNIQNTPPKYQLQVTAFYFVGRAAWTSVTVKDYAYLSERDRRNGKASIIDIPYWSAPVHCYQDILLFTGLPSYDYPCEIGPFVSPINLISSMDSMLQLSPSNLI